MNIWIVSREYAGIAEAGGVKNVTRSLAETLATLGNEVTVFMPVYKCSDFRITGEQGNGKPHFFFIEDPIFAEKRGVYTYTREDEAENPSRVAGSGHLDTVQEDIRFQRLVVERGMILGRPDVVHCQDAATALVPVYANELNESTKNFYKNTKFVVTIHNAGRGYHHSFFGWDYVKNETGFSDEIISKAFNQNLNNFEPFLAASHCATLTTVSPQYAEELKDIKNNYDTGELAGFFIKNDTPIIGITNGIDFEHYNPTNTKKSLLPFTFNPAKGSLDGKEKCRKHFFENYWDKALEKGDKKGELFCYQGRLVRQKGLDVLFGSVPKIIENNPACKIIIMGQGEKALEEWAFSIQDQFPENFKYICGYEKALSRLVIASSDFIILPSFFEPCGLTDLIAQIFGTIPIAHKTGGLCKIKDGVTGFLYEENTKENLENVINSIISKKKENPDFFNKIIKNAAKTVKTDFSWKEIVETKYMEVYKKQHFSY